MRFPYRPKVRLLALSSVVTQLIWHCICDLLSPDEQINDDAGDLDYNTRGLNSRTTYPIPNAVCQFNLFRVEQVVRWHFVSSDWSWADIFWLEVQLSAEYVQCDVVGVLGTKFSRPITGQLDVISEARYGYFSYWLLTTQIFITTASTTKHGIIICSSGESKSCNS